MADNDSGVVVKFLLSMVFFCFFAGFESLSALDMLTRMFRSSSREGKNPLEQLRKPEEMYQKFLPGCGVEAGRVNGITIVFTSKSLDDSIDSRKKLFACMESFFFTVHNCIKAEHRAFSWLSSAGKIFILFEGTEYEDLFRRMVYFWTILLERSNKFSDFLTKTIYAVFLAGELEFGVSEERDCSFIGICGTQVGEMIRAIDVITALPDDDSKLLLAPSFVAQFSLGLERLGEFSYDMSRYKILQVDSFCKALCDFERK